MNLRKKLIIFAKGFILFNVLWLIGALWMDTRALPNPIEVYVNLPKVLQNDFVMHLQASLYRIFMGLGISLIIGLTIGVLMGMSERANRLLNPLIYLTYPVPKMALMPVIMILYGLGDASKITLIVVITVFQIIVAVRDAVLHIEEEVYHYMKSLGASRFQMFGMITLPAIMPELLTNLRISVGTALSILFFAENYGTKYGLGYYIQDAWMRIDYISMYGGILLLSFVGFILFITIDGIESIVCRWNKR